jgi:hypothetical protein
MAKSPDQIVADIDRKQNEEDRDLIPRAGRALSGVAKKVYAAATGKGAKDFEPKDTNYGPGPGFEDRDAVRSPVGGYIGSGAEMRSLNMGKKSKASKASSDYKKGGMIKSSASKRADGCAIKGKTRGRMV